MQWHTPIGYSVNNGKIIVNEEQRETVQQIFTDYDNGTSAVRIAENLKERKVVNANERVAWTHASIGRILENHNYLGTERYPQIIDTELFQRVQIKREQKRKGLSRGTHRPAARERMLFSGVLICGECGEIYSHIQPKKTSSAVAKWKCKNYVYQNKVSCAGGFISDEEVMEVCTEALNQIINNRRLIRNVEETKDRISPRYRELDRQITENETDDLDDMVSLLYQRAAERYKTLEIHATDQYTAEMTEILKDRVPVKEFDEELYHRLIRQIVVYKDNTVDVVFLNGSRLKMEYGKKPVQKGAEYGSENCKKGIDDTTETTV